MCQIAWLLQGLCPLPTSILEPVLPSLSLIEI